MEAYVAQPLQARRVQMVHIIRLLLERAQARPLLEAVTLEGAAALVR